MKHKAIYIFLITFQLTSCISRQELAYLNNLPEAGFSEKFTMDIPDYKLKHRDILYITIKAMTPDGSIRDFLTSSQYGQTMNIGQSEAGGYLYGYDINSEGNIVLPIIGELNVLDLTLEESRKLIQSRADNVFNDATVECKLLSFKYTVIGEVNAPGSYVNFNNYLTVFEAIGRAGGVSDYGRRDNLLVLRPFEGGTKTYRLNLQDKSILASEAYFLLPNDVVIVEPETKKIFNLNFPTFSAIFTTATSILTTTLLLINYFGK